MLLGNKIKEVGPTNTFSGVDPKFRRVMKQEYVLPSN